MFINATGFYIPSERVHNDYFLDVNGLTNEWIQQRTGIVTRSKAAEDENINTMSFAAVENAIETLPYPIEDVDLIIAASYSPYDTVGTFGHEVQRKFNVDKARVVYISSACSSFLNALEIVEGYFATGKATKALVVSADHNTYYSNESDPKAGHLWGDAAAAFFLSKEQVKEGEARIIDIFTQGLGHIGKGPDGVKLLPGDGGIVMPDGRDVFIQACTYMAKNTLDILENNNYTLDDLSYLIGHQANMRIMSNIAKQLNLPEEKFLSNIAELGNTGSVSTALVYAQNKDLYKKGDKIVLTVFGGGYSAGVCLIQFD
ncbi:MAG TPA: 3-oxoacyl-ACP synthase [Porphyromonadaceae bacterium]|nr:3-oxoacyl-ACP synthase [Porphyromonadaceae bacterium]